MKTVYTILGVKIQENVTKESAHSQCYQWPVALERPTENRVWIELEKPRNAEHAKEICDLANNLLQRITPNTAKHFFYITEKRQYAYGDHWGYVDLTDRGEWLNLDFVGRPLDMPANKWRRTDSAASVG